MAKRTHKDVEYAVDDDTTGREHVFRTFEDAAAEAVSRAASGNLNVVLDTLVWSRAGAKWIGGSDAVEQYDEDPEASVFDRLEIRVNNVGRVP